MASPEILESMRVSDACIASHGNGLEQQSSGIKGSENLSNVLLGNGLEQEISAIKGSENLSDDLLVDLDSYFEDISERLTISRIVSDSVIKGMVKAVAEEAAEKIAMKELEVAGLKETLQLYHVGADKTGSSGSSIRFCALKGTKNGLYSSVSDAFVEYDRRRESLSDFRVAAEEQFKKLKKEINNMKGCNSMRKISSNSELVGLGGILQEVSGRGFDADKMLDSLKTTLDNVCRQVDSMVYLSEASLSEWQQEQEFQEEIEAMVIRNCIRSLQEEFEGRLWDQNAHFYGCESISWLERIKEISNLRQELDAICKSLSMSEIGQLISHGSAEIREEWNNSKRNDHAYCKVLGNHVSPSTLLSEGNGKLESKSIVPENLDSAQLKHMSKDELVTHFKTEMTNMKRNHETEVQGLTEQYFILKREFLKERGSSLLLKKDKEFDILRKKIPEVISRLDDILLENEKLPAFSRNAESLGSLKERVDNLLSENHQLKELLADKKKEVKYLSSQVSDAVNKMSQHSLAEAKLLKMIGNLKCAIEDTHIEALISEDVHKCVLSEVNGRIKFDSEESDMESTIMQEIYGVFFKEAAHIAEATSKCEIQHAGLESMIMQELFKFIFREIIKDAEAKLCALNMEYMNERGVRVSLEKMASEKEKALSLEGEEKERLKQERILLAAAIEEKENLALEATAALEKEKEQFELATQELNDLRDLTRKQQTQISESTKETDAMNCKLNEALGQIDLYKVDMEKLNQKLELSRKMLLSVTLEKQNTLLLFETKEKEQRERIESMTVLVHGLSKAIDDFECRVAEDIKRNSLRLGNMSSQLSSLIQKANIVSSTRLLYKQKLERRCSDLQKAEVEVDLLGDEVDALLSLLEKIYIALDHYSPILQHYPGIIEILKLVRRELSGESTKLV